MASLPYQCLAFVWGNMALLPHKLAVLDLMFQSCSATHLQQCQVMQWALWAVLQHWVHVTKGVFMPITHPCGAAWCGPPPSLPPMYESTSDQTDNDDSGKGLC